MLGEGGEEGRRGGKGRGGEGRVGKQSRGKSWAGEDISKVSTEEGGGWAESWRADEREETSIVSFSNK